MTSRKQRLRQASLVLLILPSLFLFSCNDRTGEDLIIFTQITTGIKDSASCSDAIARIASFPMGKNSETPVVLSSGFYSAVSPAISSDGKMMLFSGKLKKEDHWEIWEMDLTSLKSKKIISLPDDCFSPAYLPTGRVVFCKKITNGKSPDETAIFTCKSDGTDLRQVTFDPKSYSSVNVLKDGRLLALACIAGSSEAKQVLMVMRPDGTKNQLFFESDCGATVRGRAWETGTGKLVFIQSSPNKTGEGSILEISYNRPTQSAAILSPDSKAIVGSVFPLSSGKMIIVCRKSDSEKNGLFEFDPVDGKIGTAIYQSSEFDISDVVVSEQHLRARKLPSEVDLGVKSGLLLCQDINFEDISVPHKDALVRASRIRIMGKDSSLGEVDIEKDGSFYLKVKADTPFRIERIDERGNVIGKSCNWLYLRPNERRGCVGCHESQEIVPENRVPVAVKHSPVIVPVHISKVVEKKVSLE
jgi:hypothetical protein